MNNMKLRLVAVIVLLGLLFAGCGLCQMFGLTPIPTPTPTPTPTPLPRLPVSTLPAGSLPGDIWTRSTDGAVMVYVPVGEFQMGSTDEDVAYVMRMCPGWGYDCEQWMFKIEQPAHTVALDGFWIDRTEVTNGQYQQCVAAGACTLLGDNSSDTRSSYYDNPAYADYPVINVTWDQAAAYAQWVGGRLPTEAEWEYAARGPEGRIYPWGDQAPDCNTLLNFSACVGGTSQVGSYPAGASWVGALDMAGNVWEWVADWRGKYPSERQVNPTGPSTGTCRVLRGGSFRDDARHVCCAARGCVDSHFSRFVGFRVVTSPG